VRFILSVLCVASLCGLTQLATAAEDATKHACSVLSRAEVRKLVPWSDQMESLFPQAEEDQFANGSGCEYPSVRVQIMSTTPQQWQRWVDTSKNPTVERVAGVGEEAYIRDNKSLFAELYAKSGRYLVSLQKNLQPGETTQASKAGLIALAKAIVSKLPSTTAQQGPPPRSASPSADKGNACASCGGIKDTFRDPWSNEPLDPPDPMDESSGRKSKDPRLDALEARIRDLENTANFEVISENTGKVIFRVGPGGARMYNQAGVAVAAIGTTADGGYFTGRSAAGGEASIGASGRRAGVRVIDRGLVRAELGTNEGPFALRFPSGQGLLAGLGESRAGSGAVLVGTLPGVNQGSITVSDGRAIVSLTDDGRGGAAFAEATIGGGFLEIGMAGGQSAVKMGHNSQRYGIVLTGPVLGIPYVPRTGIPGSFFVGCASGEKPACLPEVAQP
jgi:hypothetical protein